MEQQVLQILVFITGIAGVTSALGTLLYKNWQNRYANRTNALVSSIIASMPDAVVVVNDENRILLCNDAFAHYLNRQTADLIGQLLTLMMPEVRPILSRLDAEQRHRIEFEFNNRFVEVVRSALQPSVGQQSGQVIVFRDMSVRKQTEVALFAYERRYRALFENSKDAIFVLDLDGTILIANQQASALLHIELDELLQVPIYQFIPDEQHADTQQHFMQLLRDATTPLHERNLVRLDAQTVPTEISLTLVQDETETPLHIQLIARDITQRKRAEAELKRRLDLMSVLRQVDEEVSYSLHIDSVALVALDAFTRLSHAAYGFIALNEGGELRVTYLLGAYPEDYKGTPLHSIGGVVGRVLRTQEPEIVNDVREDRDYQPMFADVKAQMALPLIAQEHLIGMVSLETKYPDEFNDETYRMMQLITNRVAGALDNARLYQRSVTQLEEIRELEKVKSDMIQVASHDLKSPLNILTGYMGLLEEELELDELQLQAFEAMRGSIRRMQRIVEDILSLKKIEEMIKADTDAVFSLNLQLERVAVEFEPYAVQKRHELALSALPEPDVYVAGQEVALYEALSNLVGNAIKYTPDGGRVELRLIVDYDACCVRVEIEDNGYGVPEDRQERLFEPFYRAKAEGTETIEGTGLGLHLVKTIIERHKGEVIFSSTFGKGSMFGFKLPLVGDALPC